MAMEAELVYRAQDVGGRKDAAYVIQMTNSGGNNFQVLCKWGSWQQYHNGTLTPKVDYVGNDYRIARMRVEEAHNKRIFRGYELQERLSTFPAWMPGYSLRVVPAARPPAPAPAQVAAKPAPPEQPAEPTRTRHSRAGFLKL